MPDEVKGPEPEQIWIDLSDPYKAELFATKTLKTMETQYIRADIANARITKLEQRNEALESLLACYRLGKRPTEALFQQLEATRAALNDGGK